MAGGAGNFGGTVIDIADATDNIGHRSCDNKIRHNMTERIHIMRIGQGYDVHRLTEGRDLILGGVKIPYDKGLLGHSDADVLVHAVMDAVGGGCTWRYRRTFSRYGSCIQRNFQY